jgi:isopentenyl phosphate kinase
VRGDEAHSAPLAHGHEGVEVFTRVAGDDLPAAVVVEVHRHAVGHVVDVEGVEPQRAAPVYFRTESINPLIEARSKRTSDICSRIPDVF